MAKEKHVEGEADHYIKTLIGAVLGYAADGLDMFLLSFILVFIIKDFGLTTAEAGNLTLATTIGMWIGSYIFGLLADKYGRTKILSFSIILFAVATFLMYFVDNYTVLLVLRFIIGLGTISFFSKIIVKGPGKKFCIILYSNFEIFFAT